MPTMRRASDGESLRLLGLVKQQLRENLDTGVETQCAMSARDMFDLCQFSNKQEMEKDVHSYGIEVQEILHNAATAVLYEHALLYEKLSCISDKGALIVSSGAKTGRSPQDKRIVDEPSSRDKVWWGRINIPMQEHAYTICRERALDYLNIQERLYVVDGFAGWDKKHRVKIRVITSRAYHALFMQNMLVVPTKEELAEFHPPDFIVYNAGCFPANKYTTGVSSTTTVTLHFGKGEMVILGTQYAGEMKKGILTLMMYLMPLRGCLPLHSSCNVGPNGDVMLFFGLSGTGKTTLSAEPGRLLIGDDEHVWTDTGIFNIEGGCYAKCKDLSPRHEPEIFDAIRFGAVLENVCFDGTTRLPDYANISITENTRAAYPLHHIQSVMIPAIVDTHPTNIVLLTCDAFGVLPPVSKLTADQVIYHFMSGYTSKMAGTEEGINKPTATFSSCYGAPFLALHPYVYAAMLAKKLSKHQANAWLVNTGWVGGSADGTGYRCPLEYTRRIIKSIHCEELSSAQFERTSVFNFLIPLSIEGVPSKLLSPAKCWHDSSAYLLQLKKLAKLFNENFEQYLLMNGERCPPEVVKAGPEIDE